jgi:DNA-binding PadR family transcriptional regulator
MYRDNTLIPSEAIRLLALGILATGEMGYAGLVGEVRHFAGHIVGPSLELLGAPIEVLKVEGFIEAVDSEDPDSPLSITVAGREELARLLTSSLRAPVSDINKLIIALKMRFLHLLEPKEQRLQAEMMIEICERQLVRLTELRGRHAGGPGHFDGFLDHEIVQTRERLDWFRTLQEGLG